MKDIYKSQDFWVKRPFYKRKLVWFFVFLIVLTYFIYFSKDDEVKSVKIGDVVNFKEEREHFEAYEPVLFKNISYKINRIDKTTEYFNKEGDIGIVAKGMLYLVAIDVVNKKSVLEKIKLPTITLVGKRGTYSRDKDAESLLRNPLVEEELPLNFTIRRMVAFDIPIDESVHIEMNLSGYRAILED